MKLIKKFLPSINIVDFFYLGLFIWAFYIKFYPYVFIFLLLYIFVYRLSFSFDEEKFNKFIKFTNFQNYKVSELLKKFLYLIAWSLIIAFVVSRFNQSSNLFVTLLLPIALAIAVACRQCILAINFLIEKGLFNALLLNEKFYLLKGTQPAPDWYFLEAANMAGNYSEEYFPLYELAKKASKKYQKEALKNGKEYKEIIYEQRCLPKGVYFIGDPLEVIDDYENKDKWQPEKNDVLQLEDGTYFAIFKAALGPGEYPDETGKKYFTKSGDIIIYPLNLLDEEKCWNLSDKNKAQIYNFKYTVDVGYDRQTDGSIDCGPVIIFTGEDRWME